MTYSCTKDGTLTFSATGNVQLVRAHAEGKADDCGTGLTGDGKVVFTKDANGKVDGTITTAQSGTCGYVKTTTVRYHLFSFNNLTNCDKGH